MKKIKNDHGFTLLEVLISFAMLSIIILVFFSVFQRYALVSNINEDNLVATNLAEKITIGMQENTTVLNEKYNDFYDPNAFLDLNHEIDDNFLNVEIMEQITLNGIDYYKVNTANQQFYFAIKNITTGDNSATDFSTINVIVYDKKFSKVVAENFAYISDTASEDNGSSPDPPAEEDPIAVQLAIDVLQSMDDNFDLIQQNYLDNVSGTTFFDTDNSDHVIYKNRNFNKNNFFFHENNEGSCPSEINEVATCYEYEDSDTNETYLFTIENITESSDDGTYTIEVRVYDSNNTEIEVKPANLPY